MSKLKINQKVVVKSTGNVGVIKSREIKNLDNGRVEIEYVVKEGEGFNNWNVYKKHELERYESDAIGEKDKTIVKFVHAPNKYIVTLVAVTKITRAWRYDENLEVHRQKGKELSIGYAIYNPNDEYDSKKGIKLAKHRAKTAPFCHMESDFSGEFNSETVNALLDVKAEYILNNIDKFINRK